MTTDALLLVARNATGMSDVLETHADRLRRRGCADTIQSVTYDREPGRECREEFAGLSADRVFAVPLFAAHCHETLEEIPAALSHVPGTVQYCEPVGQSPAVTEILRERAAAHHPPSADTSVVIVAFGSSGHPYHRQTAEHHATRIEEQTEYGEVVTCYLLQNPAAECARYTVSNDRVVAVPLFISETTETEQSIPEALELDRGGIAYGDVLGTHRRMTDAIVAEVAKQRVLAGDSGSGTFETTIANQRFAIATDGEGPPR